ncbi:MAG: hypothetical protein KAJ14_15595 [Candidatus Omnitrophica bacterium]|nr:hypothetical protein [Candidatus Omnitrophota bacterium]
MKRLSIFIIGILFLGLVSSCGKSNTSSLPENISLETLLPDLDAYGFTNNKKTIISKDQYEKIVAQFKVSKQDLDKMNFPLETAKGNYNQKGNYLLLSISKFKNNNKAVQEFEKQKQQASEQKDNANFQKAMKISDYSVKNVMINGNNGYSYKYKMAQYYKYMLIWPKGVYTFQIEHTGNESWEEQKALEIAKEMNY